MADHKAADTPDTAKAIELLRQGTPGPWRVIKMEGPFTGTIYTVDQATSDGPEVAMMEGGDAETEGANARRIAALPALVEVFAAAVHLSEAGAAGTALDAAIAKVCKGVLNNG